MKTSTSSKSIFQKKLLPLTITLLSAASAVNAQDNPELEGDEIVVTGYRVSLAKAIDIKRSNTDQVDAIVAEDIGKFPDANLAESMQRIAGVSIDREGGEGRQISIRGMGSDFTRVRISGLEALSTAGQSSLGPNRTRGFDFNTFASELFTRVEVHKTQSAKIDEGSLGSTVDLQAGRPFDYDGLQLAGNIQAGYNELSESSDPRISGLISNKSENGVLGGLISFAYSERQILEEGYNPVRFDWGNGYGTSTNSNATNQFGFCSPVGYTPQTPRDPLSTETSTSTTNNSYGSFGIDANNCATGIPRPENTAANVEAYETATNSWHPRYPGWRRQDQELTRLGITGALQFQPTDATLINLDLLYSKYEKDQREDILGVNLHRAVNLGGKTQIVVREAEKDSLNRLTYAVLDNVDFRTESNFYEENTEFAQYSLGIEHDFSDTLTLTSLIGHSQSEYARPINSTITLDNTNLDGFIYDARKSFKTPVMTYPFDLVAADSWQWLGFGTVPVNSNGSAKGSNISEVRLAPQYVDNSFDTIKVDLSWDLNETFTLSSGISYKDYTMESQEFRHMSYGMVSQALPAGTNVADISQTLMNFGNGINAAPDAWLVPDFDKVASVLGIYSNSNTGEVGGDYRLASIGHFGASPNNFTVNEETIGLYVQTDFHTTFLDRDLRGNIGVRFTQTDILSTGYVACPGRSAVAATDTTPAIPAAAPGDLECSGSKPYIGISSLTATPGNRYYLSVDAGNSYVDTLPSLNLAWDVADDLVLRFGAAMTMARPNLNAMSPGISSVPTTYKTDEDLYAVNVGNPEVDPYRATTYDLGAEWYFAEDSLLSLAVFYKDIDSYIQRVRQVQTWNETGWPVELLPAGFDGNETFAVQSYYNTPGGPLSGMEIAYQQPFTFLPGVWQNFGFQANYTRVESELDYVESSTVDSTTRVLTTTYVTNDLINMSPSTYNFTLYYDDGKFSARISSSYRDSYITSVLVPQAGSALDGSQIFTADVEGKQATTNYDFNMSYQFTKQISLTFEATNLTDEFDDQYGDSTLQYPTKYSHVGHQYYLGARYKF